MMRPTLTFVRHYVEMVVAMAVGMAVLYPLWRLGLGVVGLDAARWAGTLETDSLVMATTMAVPMAAWMRLRGHRWRPALEMSAAMYAGFVVLWPAAWVGAVSRVDVLQLGHVLMLAAMLVAMLARRGEYTGACGHTRPTPDGVQSQPASRAAR